MKKRSEGIKCAAIVLLLGDNERIHFGEQVTVAEAAKAAIAKLQAP